MKFHRITALALAGGVLFGSAGVAHAAPAHDGSVLKQRADEAVQRRLYTLADLRQRVSADEHLADADRTELLSEIDADTTGLTALDQTIQADTDPDTLKADVKKNV